ncbi:hypothetical protein [Candidatus Mycobacterium methanotrophicum]|uniref:Uncharacterized protein n=1 Tax=Candidatus Mycobacterium methanotrophicum TaxID=2943498 RepID=A0ABY4QTV1_9MYCO|nr:hypothetical protein [Candidatus Mycobacterium methanotrophicum]UQX13389.1 hypothetical protein M5I08_11500 [Candidatus Mycobacterium methanotrophicum]
MSTTPSMDREWICWVGDGLSTNPMLGRNLMACTGIEYCKLSFAEIRVRETVLDRYDQAVAHQAAA